MCYSGDLAIRKSPNTKPRLSVMSLGHKDQWGLSYHFTVYNAEKVAHQHAQNVTFGLFAAARLFREN